MQAAEMEKTAIAQLLLDKGADVNHRGGRGYTPLHIAVDMCIDGTIQTGGHPGDEPTEMVELLLKHGAEVVAPDENGKTALDWAMDYKSKKIANLLTNWQAHGGSGSARR